MADIEEDAGEEVQDTQPDEETQKTDDKKDEDKDDKTGKGDEDGDADEGHMKRPASKMAIPPAKKKKVKGDTSDEKDKNKGEKNEDDEDGDEPLPMKRPAAKTEEKKKGTGNVGKGKGKKGKSKFGKGKLGKKGSSPKDEKKNKKETKEKKEKKEKKEVKEKKKTKKEELEAAFNAIEDDEDDAEEPEEEEEEEDEGEDEEKNEETGQEIAEVEGEGRDRSKANKFYNMIKKGGLPEAVMHAWHKCGTRKEQTKLINNVFVMDKKGKYVLNEGFELPGSYAKDRTTERTDLAKDSQSGYGKTIFMRQYQLSADDLEECVRNGEVRKFKSGDIWLYSAVNAVNESAVAKKTAEHLKGQEQELNEEAARAFTAVFDRMQPEVVLPPSTSTNALAAGSRDRQSDAFLGVYVNTFLF